MKGVQIEIYHYATRISGGRLSDSDRAQGHYGGSRELHEETQRAVYELDKSQAKALLASTLLFSTAFQDRKKDLTLQEYISTNAKNTSYDSQMKEYLSKNMEDRFYFSGWFDPRNQSAPLSITVVRLDGELVYVDELFYRSKFLSDFSNTSPSKNESIEDTELTNYVLKTDEIVSFLPKITSETILKIVHFEGMSTKSSFEIKGFGKFLFREIPFSSYTIGQTNYSVVESVLQHIKKYDFQNVDAKYRVKDGRVNQSKLEGEHVAISVRENRKLVTFLFETSDKTYAEKLIKLEEFALELFKNIPDKR